MSQVEEISTEEAEGFLKLQSQLTDLGPAVHQLHKRYSSDGHLTKEWGEVTREMADILPPAPRDQRAPHAQGVALVHGAC